MAKSKSTFKIRSRFKGDVATIQCQLTHPMESGLRKDKKGKIIPAHFIQKFTCEHAGDLVLDTELNGTVSKNPYIKFRLKGVKEGDTLKLHWVDNKGNSDTAEMEMKSRRKKKK